MADDPQLQALREQVALANRLLHHYGLGTYQGHVSARVPDSDLVLIRATPAVSLERVEADDLMLIDLDGNVVQASERYPVTAEGSPHRDIVAANAAPAMTAQRQTLANPQRRATSRIWFCLSSSWVGLHVLYCELSGGKSGCKESVSDLQCKARVTCSHLTSSSARRA